jgi:hypothetical protein
VTLPPLLRFGVIVVSVVDWEENWPEIEGAVVTEREALPDTVPVIEGSFESASAGIEYVPRFAATTQVSTTW